ncbi:MAG: type IVB secretion system protein DotG/IcmE [Coxiellaceae bacterium]|nr:type IVB secretion system protein DotG/IcmE [Coxiellaceae bacterium]
MSDKKSFLKSAQSRVFLAIGLIIFAIALIGVLIHLHNRSELNAAGAAVSGGPGLASIPGAGNPSDAYVKAQNIANVEGEEQARKEATAYVPTITRAGFVGNPDEFGQAPSQSTTTPENKNCAINKVVLMYKPNPENCTDQRLAAAHQSGVTAEELMCQGCACPALKVAGYNAGDLKAVGMTAAQLKACGFGLEALVSAGFSAAALKDAGYSAADLKAAGFTAGELKAAGFDADALKKAGYSAAALNDAGLSDEDIQAANKKTGDCSVANLTKEREAGVSAETLKDQDCGIDALKAAGFTASQLKAAGFSAADLKQAGFTNAALSAAGFTPAEIQKADLDAKSCNVEKIKQEREEGMSATALRDQGCGLAALKAAGYSAGALRAAGFSAAELKKAGFSAKDLKNAGFSAAALKAAGFSAAQLKDAGYSASALKDAGFSAAALKDAGYSAADLKNAGFSAAQLRKAGYSAAALKAAGFSAGQLKAAGFSAGQLASGGFSAKELAKAGYTAAQLHAAGFGASALKNAGFSAADLKAAGFTAGDLTRAGYAGSEQPVVAQAPPADSLAASPGTAASATSLPSIGTDSSEARLAQIEKQQQAEMSVQQQRDTQQRMMAYMMSQAGKFMSGWSNVSTQSLQKAPEADSKKSLGDTASGLVSGAANNLTGGSSGAAATDGAGGPIIKAGSVLFGVLETSVNSDENTPIMARIVSGELSGSKLLGTFTRENDKVLIQFTMLSNPSYRKSIPINAVAIDPTTARTAISGQVNNHYLLRYGSMFASSFLQGIAEGVVNAGTTSTCLFGSTGCTLNQSPLDTVQQIEMGFGKVGQAYAQHMSKNFTLPPTIRISAGTGFGLLLMGDLEMPAQTISAQAKS